MSGVGDYAATANQNPFFLKADNLRGKRGLRGAGRSPSPTAVPPAPPGRHSLGSCCHLPTDRPTGRGTDRPPRGSPLPSPRGTRCVPPRGSGAEEGRGACVCPPLPPKQSVTSSSRDTRGREQLAGEVLGRLTRRLFCVLFHSFIYLSKKKRREIC